MEGCGNTEVVYGRSRLLEEDWKIVEIEVAEVVVVGVVVRVG